MSSGTVTDIGLRMLQPRELARAQGFGDEYVLEGTKTSQIARIGNSVPPPVVEAIVRTVYGGDDVVFVGRAKGDLKRMARNGWDRLPVCVAKTQSSLSADPKLRCRPSGFCLTTTRVPHRVASSRLATHVWSSGSHSPQRST